MKSAIYLVFILTALSVTDRGQVHAVPIKEDPLHTIEQANANFGAAFAKGDANAVAQMYTEKARLLPPNASLVEGRKSIEEFWKGVMEAGIKEIELKTVEVESFGDTIVEQGTASLFGKDKTVADKVKYVVIWKRVDGKWMLHRDCWNSSQPISRK